MNRVWYPALGVTLANAVAGLVAIFFVVQGLVAYSLVALIGAALFDVADGAVARFSRQTLFQKKVGIIADSLADVVSFGVFPAVMLAVVGKMHPIALVIAVLYLLAAVYRLIVFSARALPKLTPVSAPIKTFTGLPVTASALFIPLAGVLFLHLQWFNVVLLCVLVVLAVLYISKIPIPKPRGRAAYIGYAITAFVLTIGLLL